jgi:hypothetical protein
MSGANPSIGHSIALRVLGFAPLIPAYNRQGSSDQFTIVIPAKAGIQRIQRISMISQTQGWDERSESQQGACYHAGIRCAHPSLQPHPGAHLQKSGPASIKPARPMCRWFRL